MLHFNSNSLSLLVRLNNAITIHSTLINWFSSLLPCSLSLRWILHIFIRFDDSITVHSFIIHCIRSLLPCSLYLRWFLHPYPSSRCHIRPFLYSPLYLLPFAPM